MDTDQIKVLIALEKIGNITKAADSLGVSQPYLSKSLRQIEERLGIKIFYRLPRSLKVTKEGEIYLKTFKDILNLLASAEKEVNSLQNDLLEEVIIGVHPILGKFLVSELEKEIEPFPSIELKYVFKNSRDIIQDVLDCKIDFGIVADAKDYPELIIKPLWKENIGLYSKDGELKNKILFNSNMIFNQKILNKLECKSQRSIDDYAILYSILIRTNSMGLLPAPIADAEGKLVLIEAYKPPISVSLVYRADKKRTRSLSKVVKIIQECSKALH